MGKGSLGTKDFSNYVRFKYVAKQETKDKGIDSLVTGETALAVAGQLPKTPETYMHYHYIIVGSFIPGTKNHDFVGGKFNQHPMIPFKKNKKSTKKTSKKLKQHKKKHQKMRQHNMKHQE